MDARPRYLAVEGPLGVGKTALAGLLAARLGARAVLEPGPNPFLGGLYDEPRRDGFQAQLYWLLSRYQQKDELHQEDLFARGGVVSDYLFACDRILAQVNLSPRRARALRQGVRPARRARCRGPIWSYTCRQGPRCCSRGSSGRGGPVPARDYIERVSRGLRGVLFSTTETARCSVVNTSEIDFVENRAELDDLVAVIQTDQGRRLPLQPAWIPLSRDRDGGAS